MADRIPGLVESRNYDRDTALKIAAARGRPEWNDLDEDQRTAYSTYLRGYLTQHPEDQEIRGAAPTESQAAQRGDEAVQQANAARATAGVEKYTTPEASLRSVQAGQGATAVAPGTENMASFEAQFPEMRAQSEGADEEARLRAIGHRTVIETTRLIQDPHQQAAHREARFQQIDAMPLEQLRAAFGPTDQAQQALGAVDKDKSLPSASGMKGLYADPEYAPSFEGRQPRPPIYFQEPPIKQFREEMRPILGAGADSLDENSIQYRVYSDAQYKNAYDKAKQMGVGIVRLKYARNQPSMVQRGVEGARNALNAGLRGATLGASDLVDVAGSKLGTALGGPVTDPLTENAMREAGTPVASQVGSMAGMLTPGGPASEVFGGIERGLSKVPVLGAKGGVKGILSAGLRGGAGAAAVGALEDASRASAQAIAEDNPEALKPSADTVKRAVLRAIIGAPLGASGELLGAGAGKLRANLRNPAVLDEESRALANNVNAFERGGGKLGVGGLKPSPEMQRQLEVAGAKGVSPVDVAVSEVSPQILKQALKAQDQVLTAAKRRKIQAVIDAESVNAPKAVPWDAVDAMMQRAKKARLEGGEPLPGISSAEEMNFLNGAVKVKRAMDPKDAEAYVRRNHNARLYDPADLQNAGFNLAGVGWKPGKSVVVEGTPIGPRKAVDWYDKLQEDVRAYDRDPSAFRQNVSAKQTLGAIRGFIGERYPGVDKALADSHVELSAMEQMHADAGLPREIGQETVTLPGRRRGPPEGYVPKKVPLDQVQTLHLDSPYDVNAPIRHSEASTIEQSVPVLKPDEQRAFESTLRAPKSLRSKSALEGYASAGEATLRNLRPGKTGVGASSFSRELSAAREAARTLQAYRTLESHIAVPGLSRASDVHPYLTAGPHGPRVGGLGRLSAVRLRTDPILAALERMPSNERLDLQDMAQTITARLKAKFGAKALEELRQQMVDKTSKAIELAMLEPKQGAAYRAQAEVGTVPGKLSQATEDTVNFSATPEGRIVRANELAKELPSLVQQYVRQRAAARGLEPTVGKIGRTSIRAGQAAKPAAGIDSGRKRKLSADELAFLKLILQAQPEKKKAVGQ